MPPLRRRSSPSLRNNISLEVMYDTAVQRPTICDDWLVIAFHLDSLQSIALNQFVKFAHKSPGVDSRVLLVKVFDLIQSQVELVQIISLSRLARGSIQQLQLLRPEATPMSKTFTYRSKKYLPRFILILPDQIRSKLHDSIQNLGRLPVPPRDITGLRWTQQKSSRSDLPRR